MADGPSPGRSRAPIWGSAFLALGASTGAMGAHALEGVLTPQRLDSWETASLYLLVMGAALVGAGSGRPSRWAARALAAVAWGTALFSTSIFALVVLATVDTGSGVRAVLGPLTPVWRGADDWRLDRLAGDALQDGLKRRRFRRAHLGNA